VQLLGLLALWGFPSTWTLYPSIPSPLRPSFFKISLPRLLPTIAAPFPSLPQKPNVVAFSRGDCFTAPSRPLLSSQNLRVVRQAGSFRNPQMDEPAFSPLNPVRRYHPDLAVFRPTPRTRFTILSPVRDVRRRLILYFRAMFSSRCSIRHESDWISNISMLGPLRSLTSSNVAHKASLF